MTGKKGKDPLEDLLAGEGKTAEPKPGEPIEPWAANPPTARRDAEPHQDEPTVEDRERAIAMKDSDDAKTEETRSEQKIREERAEKRGEKDGKKRDTKDEPAGENPHVTQAQADLEQMQNLRDLSEEFEEIDAYDLYEQIADADKVEIAFVDDRGQELPIPPHSASFDGFSVGTGGESVNFKTEGLELSAPVAGERALSLGGYALILDGEHVATGMRDEPLRMGPGLTFDLSDDISFR